MEDNLLYRTLLISDMRYTDMLASGDSQNKEDLIVILNNLFKKRLKLADMVTRYGKEKDT